MKKEIVSIDEKRGIARVTTADERWYTRETTNPQTGLPEIDFRKSVTYIGHFYPKGKGFENWMKKNGEEADMLVALAGERGSKVHQAIEALNNGEQVKMTDTFLNTRTGAVEQLTPEEYGAVMSYRDWWMTEGSKEYVILEAEQTIWPEGKGAEPGGPLHFAGTLDLLVKRVADGAIGIIDIKTSKEVYTGHIIQLSALREGKKAEGVDVQFQAILQVGYKRNKQGFKFTEQEHRFDLFLAAKNIADYETSGEAPLQRDYPLALTLGLPKKKRAIPSVTEPAAESAPIAEEAPEQPEPAKVAKKKSPNKHG
ncbi:MAG: hypothetical protein Q8L86_12430 [Vicinamibacterales bacterium]|nr:hypothetical protein [Vicinamibacterales bacterium]